MKKEEYKELTKPGNLFCVNNNKFKVVSVDSVFVTYSSLSGAYDRALSWYEWLRWCIAKNVVVKVSYSNEEILKIAAKLEWS